MKSVKKIAITGAAGQIAYSLLFRIAKGDLLGQDQPIILSLLEVPEFVPSLEGLKMELDDCAFPLLRDIHVGSNPKEIFKDADYVFLVGAKPRGPGMERSDLLKDNAKIFVEQGQALDQAASRQVKVLVVGNPCNTNCLIAMHHAPSLTHHNFFAMTMLDHNRAIAALAKKAGTEVALVSNMTIWGNHSSTQVSDFTQAKINNKPLHEIIKDRSWLENDFFTAIQKRGAAVINARGKSSAASAANAAIDGMRAILNPTKAGDWFSCGIYSNGNPYGIADDLYFSFPCRSHGDGKLEIIKGLSIDQFIEAKIKLTEKELLEERSMVEHLIRLGATHG